MVQEAVRVEDVATTSAFGWRRLAGYAGAVAAVAHVAIGAGYRDVDAIVVAVTFGIALGLMRVRSGTVGLVVLLLAFANVAFWTVPATATNLDGGFGFAAIAVPGVMAVLSVAGLVATVGALTTRRQAAAGEAGALLLTVAAGLVLVVIVGLAALAGGAAIGAQPGDHVITTDRTAFSESEIVAQAGTIGVFVENRDYFWHTFTITELGVNLRVPIGASGRVTFEATPGTYEFVCAIPGHDRAGMVGTLTVVGD
jgi:plastocyanin